jgi:chemotaxis methyl-accepting protein methylase
VLERLAETLAPGGVLLLGESETVQGRSDLFQEVAGSPGFYSPTEMPVARLAG